jgi:peroxiredoxin Q/BCP
MIDGGSPLRDPKESSMAMLEVGETAPDFTTRTHSGRDVTLSDLRGKRVVLWFYPKADTPG